MRGSKLRNKLLKAKRGSKLWWKLSSEILQKSGKSSSVPALKSGGEWILKPEAKSNTFANVFASKFVLPQFEPNEYSAIAPVNLSDSRIRIQDDDVSKVFDKLDINSGTGPDGVASRVLKECSRELSGPFAMLLQQIVVQGFWPTAWTEHWLFPLHKTKSVFDPVNYRAINLTAQVSKVAERVLASHFVPVLEQSAFGTYQFAYRKEHGARDAVVFYVLSWIRALNEGSRVGVYCSDVSGAFDKVSVERLLQKLASFGLSCEMFLVLKSWLRLRSGFVIVAGKKSLEMRLKDMVFQGTVWGPPLWNTYFGDCICAIQGCGFEVVIFADDCNAFKVYPRSCRSSVIFEDLRECQRALHRWGQANAVTFDAGKEDFLVLCGVEPSGGPAKLLGIEFDNRLRMAIAVHNCAAKASWKTKTLLRSWRFFSTTDLIMMFKSHVLSFIEYRTPGIYHACSTVLSELDLVLSRFLMQIGLSEADAFMHFNLAPLCVRRDIAMLGVIHRAVLRKGPPSLWQFFVFDQSAPPRRSARSSRHSKQLLEHSVGRNLEMMRRSALGLISVYNMLPEEAVSKHNVSEFQHALTEIVRHRFIAQERFWKFTLSTRCDIMTRRRLLQ